MQFGAPARKLSTNIMAVLEDDVYLVRLQLGFPQVFIGFGALEGLQLHWRVDPNGTLMNFDELFIISARKVPNDEGPTSTGRPRKACQCIAAIGATDVMDNLPDLFHDEAPSVRQAALDALATFPDVGKTL